MERNIQNSGLFNLNRYRFFTVNSAIFSPFLFLCLLWMLSTKKWIFMCFNSNLNDWLAAFIYKCPLLFICLSFKGTLRNISPDGQNGIKAFLLLLMWFNVEIYLKCDQNRCQTGNMFAEHISCWNLYKNVQIQTFRHKNMAQSQVFHCKIAKLAFEHDDFWD